MRMLNAHWWEQGCFCCTRVLKRSSGIWRARENRAVEREFAEWTDESLDWAKVALPVGAEAWRTDRNYWDWFDDDFYSNTEWPDEAIWRA